MLRLVNKIFNKPNYETNYVIISGEVKGKIIDAENIVVTATGYCDTSITAKRLEIAGVVKGDIQVENLIIRSSGQLTYGKISYIELVLDNGSTMAPSHKNGMRRKAKKRADKT